MDTFGILNSRLKSFIQHNGKSIKVCGSNNDSVTD